MLTFKSLEGTRGASEILETDLIGLVGTQSSSLLAGPHVILPRCQPHFAQTNRARSGQQGRGCEKGLQRSPEGTEIEPALCSSVEWLNLSQRVQHEHDLGRLEKL